MAENSKDKKVTKPSTAKKPTSTKKPIAIKEKKPANAIELDEHGLIKEKIDLSYKNKKLVSITGCAAGIAHTFMAAEGISTASSKMGIKARVETHGVGGPESILTAKEIREADIVLISAEIAVDLARFIGKKVYVTDTALALKNPQQLIIDAFTKGSEYRIDPKGQVKVQGGNPMGNQSENSNSVIKHIMFALGWTIPLITAAGLMMAIGNIFSMSVYETFPSIPEQLGILYLADAYIGTDFQTWFNTNYEGLITVNVDPLTNNLYDISTAPVISMITVHYEAYDIYSGAELKEMANDAWSVITDPSSAVYADAVLVFGDQINVVDKILNQNPSDADYLAWSIDPMSANYFGQHASMSVWGFEGKPLAGAFSTIGQTGLKLMYPLLAGALALSIGTKVAFVPAFIGGWVMNDGTFIGPEGIYADGQPVGTGFIGALIIGFLIGYIMRGLRKIPIHKSIQGVTNLVFLPFVGTIIMLFLAKYIVGWPLGLLVAEMYSILNTINTDYPNAIIFLAALLGMMMATDLGGPINKTALIFGAAVMTTTMTNNPTDISQWNFAPNTAVIAAISVPPIGAFFATQIFGRYFSSADKTSGVNAGIMGLTGITEGAIPFAIAKPVAFVPANMIGGAYTGAMAVALGLQFWGGIGSPLGVFLGYVTLQGGGSYLLTVAGWMFATLSGALVTAIIAGLVVMGQTKKSRFTLRSKTLKVEMKRQIEIINASVAAGKTTEAEAKIQIEKIKADVAQQIKDAKPKEKAYEQELAKVRKTRYAETTLALKTFVSEQKPKLAAAKNDAAYAEAYAKMESEIADLKSKMDKAIAEQKSLLKQAKADDKYKFSDKIVDLKVEFEDKVQLIKNKNKFEVQIAEFKAEKSKLSDNIKRVNNTYLNSLQILEPLNV